VGSAVLANSPAPVAKMVELCVIKINLTRRISGWRAVAFGLNPSGAYLR
jgi:hypothetical protein